MIDLTPFQQAGGGNGEDSANDTTAAYLHKHLPDGDTPTAVAQLLHELRLARDRVRDDLGRLLSRQAELLGRVAGELEGARATTAQGGPQIALIAEGEVVGEGEGREQEQEKRERERETGKEETQATLLPRQLEQLDEVRGRVARGDWEEAALLLDRLANDPALTVAVGEEQERLIGSLLLQLGQPLVSKTQLVQSVQWLMVLGRGDLARERFLSARSQAIREGQR